MADISKIKIKGVVYSLKDIIARAGGSGGTGTGEDGFSPLIDVVQTTEGDVILTVTDKEGTETVTIPAGTKGDDGQDGGYYTPSVDGDWLTWKASKSGMPGVMSANIRGPQGEQGIQGPKGDTGTGFSISKTYSSVSAMNSGYATDGVPLYGFVLIDTGNVNDTDNAKLYVKGNSSYEYLTDLSGSQGIKGETGAKGADGVSPTITTSKTGKVTTITIKDATGTKTATINDGAKGDKGEAGSDGMPGSDGYSPVKGVDYWTEADKQAIQDYNEQFIKDELIARNQVKLPIVSSVEEMTDTNLLYLMDVNGSLWLHSYTKFTIPGGQPTFKNWMDYATEANSTEIYNGGLGYKAGWRLSSNGTEKEASDVTMSGYIPATKDSVLRIKGVKGNTSANMAIKFYNSSYSILNNTQTPTQTTILTFKGEDGIILANPISALYSSTAIAYLRFCGVPETTNEDIICTIDQEITYTTAGVGYEWKAIQPFVLTDHSADIVELKNKTEEHDNKIASLENSIKSGGITDATEKDAWNRMKDWRYPINENAPVFLIEKGKEKPAITEERTVQAVYDKYDALMNNGNSHYITKEEYTDSDGNPIKASDGTTPLYAYHFREPEPLHPAGAWSEPKPVIIAMSGIHPSEVAGIYSLYYAMEEITNNPELSDLRRNVHFVILPMVQPTGLTDNVYGVRNPAGIQLHYQFEVDFKYPGTTSDVHGTRNYAGEAPLTIPEARFIDDMMQRYVDIEKNKEQDKLVCVLSCHSNDVDTYWGSCFVWFSAASHTMCNLGFRFGDKMSNAWREKYGETFETGVKWANKYVNEKTNSAGEKYWPQSKLLPDWDYRAGKSSISSSGGTEYKQATKYGVFGVNVEVCARCMVIDQDYGKTLTPAVTTMGAETYCNFFRTFMAVYPTLDKDKYAPNLPWSE